MKRSLFAAAVLSLFASAATSSFGATALAAAASKAVPSESSRDYLAFLSDAEKSSLASSGDVRNFGAKMDDLSLWKRAPFGASVAMALGSRQSTIAAESLFLVDLPKDAGAPLDLSVLRAFTAFSTMKGLQVYSASLKRMETFIYDSWRVDSLEAKNALPDPVFSSAPSGYDCLIFQKEEQTGAIYSTLHFERQDGFYLLTLENLTELRYLFFTLVAPRDLKTLFVIVPTSDKLVVYCATVAKTPSFLGLERLKQSSFFYRMKALASWFAGNLSRE